MTYKAIVERMIEIDATKFIEKTLENNNIDFSFATPYEVSMENDKEEDTIFWDVKVEIYDRKHLIPTRVIVGGTADSHCLICSSAIWDIEKKNLLWLSVKETREQLGIKEFKLA